MKNLSFILFLFIAVSFTACEKEQINEVLPFSNNEETLKSSNQVAICHQSGNGEWHIININMNAWPAHEAHGDAIDKDGDGYFDRECGCSEVDCDDEDPNVNSDCGNQSEGPLSITIDNTTVYVFPEDNSTLTGWGGGNLVCNELEAFGYSDWYMPSKEELDAMYNQLDAGVMNGQYWSSTQVDREMAWYQDFNSGNQNMTFKMDKKQCRCIRK